jgi:hypothetical protein
MPAADQESGATGTQQNADRPAIGAASVSDGRAEEEDLPKLVIYKSPTCGCCDNWAEHMRAAGFDVEIRDTQDVATIKADAGVPAGLGSCHTAQVAGYFVEGHVPADEVKRLLVEKPDALGLAVPGMPVGSPGMAQGNVRQPYDVLLVGKDGSISVYSHHGGES